MRAYASSRFRLLLLAALLALTIFAIHPLYAQTAATPAPAAPGTPSTVVETSSGNPFSLVLQNLDFVFVIIALLSITGLTLIIQGFIKNRREVFMPAASLSFIHTMIEGRNIDELATFTANDPSFISQAVNRAIRRYPDFERMKEAMETGLSELTADAFRRIEYLNIIGNLGPLLGLLGTVLGMIEAFQAMHVAAGQANPAQLAGGISKALAHTMLGLLLAVPCLAAFGVLRTMVDRLTNQAAITCEEYLLALRGDHHGLPQRPLAPPPAVRQPHPIPAASPR